jgi:hypothetical protein
MGLSFSVSVPVVEEGTGRGRVFGAGIRRWGRRDNTSSRSLHPCTRPVRRNWRLLVGLPGPAGACHPSQIEPRLRRTACYQPITGSGEAAGWGLANSVSPSLHTAACKASLCISNSQAPASSDVIACLAASSPRLPPRPDITILSQEHTVWCTTLCSALDHSLLTWGMDSMFPRVREGFVAEGNVGPDACRARRV